MIEQESGLRERKAERLLEFVTFCKESLTKAVQGVSEALFVASISSDYPERSVELARLPVWPTATDRLIDGTWRG